MGPAWSDGFVHFDDNVYVTENPRVLSGLTTDGAAWAFTSFDAANWHPLSWLSHMADVSLFGLDPRGHHATSIGLHALNAALLVPLLRSLTGVSWPSFLVAALFAVHPLHVESVAWVSERKDLLSTCLLLLSLGAWARSRRCPGRRWSLAAVVLFALGLLAKPMVVILPVLLLVLDYWPLGRWPPPGAPGGRTAGDRVPAAQRLLVEKTPFFALAAGSFAITVAAQRYGGGLQSMEAYPLLSRIENGLVAYVRYLAKTVWPSRLSFFYPHPGDAIPGYQWAGALLLLLAVTAAAFAVRRRRPYFLAGWLWYLAALVPAIGIVQVGNQALADRYTYVPLLGLFAAAAAVLGAAARRGARWRGAAAGLAAAGLCAMIPASRTQARVWRDDLSLNAHAVQVSEGNWVAHVGYGLSLSELGRTTEAVEQYRQALRSRPDYFEAQANLGEALFSLRRYPEAAEALARAVALQPDRTVVLYRLGLVYLAQGDGAAARKVAATLQARDPFRAQQLLQRMAW
jgi:tetratricopeptide (TPR) repeat protein